MITPKQRAYLRKLSQNLDPIFQVGKSGVTPELVKAVDDALKVRELVKMNVLPTCEDDLELVADKVSKRTHSDVVMMMGHRFVVYRRAKKPVIEFPQGR